MVVLDWPKFSEDLSVAVTLTGVKFKKEGSYNYRHKFPKGVGSWPGLGVVKEKIIPPHLRRNPPKIQVKKKKCSNQEPPAKKVERKKEYVINKSQVRHRLLNWVNIKKDRPQLYFWTVSFPLGTRDEVGNLLLNKWLTRLRQEKKIKNYLWVSERQENGTIHYHIAIPHYLNVQKANKYMRACIFTCIDQGLINYSRKEAVKYNGVDIAKDRKTKRIVNFALQKKQRSLVNYITKYVTKNNGTFQQLAWHCSRDFSNLVLEFRITDSELIKSLWLDMINHAKVFHNDFILFKPWLKKPPDKVSEYLGFINHSIINLN